MKAEKFDSQLGEVAVTRTRIERKKRQSEEWERIEESFSEEKMVEAAEYAEVDDIKLEKGSVYPNIRLKINGEWKRIFFQVGDKVEECFKRLRYRWQSFKQNN